MFLSGLKYLRRLERQVKFAKNRCCKIKPVAVHTYHVAMYIMYREYLQFIQVHGLRITAGFDKIDIFTQNNTSQVPYKTRITTYSIQC